MVKKICIITTVDFSLSAFVVPIIKELQNDGFDVTLMASMSDDFIERHKNDCRLINVQMERGAKPIGMLKAIRAFYKIFRKEKFDIIQYATPNAAFYGSIASKLAGCKKRVYCQWGIRYVGFEGMQRRLFKNIEIATCKLSTHIRPASWKNLEFAVSEGHYSIDKATVIGDGGTVGIDFLQFNVNKKDSYKGDMLIRYPQLKGQFVFGFIGRLDKDKGLNELFEAFISISHSNKNATLLIVGPMDKPEGIDSVLLDRVKKMPNVIFTGYTREIAEHISCMDVLVHPSYREGFSMVIQQAMAMKVPVITTDIPGPSEIVVNGESGVTVTVKSSSELLESMTLLIDDSSIRLSMAEAGYQRAKKLFNRKRMVELTILDRNKILNG